MERREIADVEGVVPLPGAMELLQALPLERWAIVTSCTRALASVRIGAAGLPKPKHLITATDVKHGKPDPEPYLAGARILAVPASECIVIEDAPAGIRAGKAAGARVLALRTTASDAEPLGPSGTIASRAAVVKGIARSKCPGNTTPTNSGGVTPTIVNA